MYFLLSSPHFDIHIIMTCASDLRPTLPLKPAPRDLLEPLEALILGCGGLHDVLRLGRLVYSVVPHGAKVPMAEKARPCTA
jgi:hypothetical protein